MASAGSRGIGITQVGSEGLAAQVEHHSDGTGADEAEDCCFCGARHADSQPIHRLDCAETRLVIFHDLIESVKQPEALRSKAYQAPLAFGRLATTLGSFVSWGLAPQN